MRVYDYQAEVKDNLGGVYKYYTSASTIQEAEFFVNEAINDYCHLRRLDADFMQVVKVSRLKVKKSEVKLSNGWSIVVRVGEKWMPCKFTTSDDTKEFDGYFKGDECGGWDSVALTREQLQKFFTPYPVEFTEGEDSPSFATVKAEDILLIESSPLWVDDSRFIEGYKLDGLEIMVKE